ALGANEGMAFDGGGSSTLVARRLGEPTSEIVNSPSDRVERPVGNGVFVYSTAPVGPAVRLVARPAVVRALSGAATPVRVAAVDAASHVAASGGIAYDVEPHALGVFRDGTFYAGRAGSGRAIVRSGPLKGTIALEVRSSPAILEIEPPKPNVDDGGSLQLSARAFDDRGYALALPSGLQWHATVGRIDARGVYRAASRNANVAVRVGSVSATALVTVGTHEESLPFAERARFSTAPRGGSGSLTRDPQCGSCVALAFSFGTNERAAYAMADLPLPPQTIGIAFDVLDDGSASRLRIALRNAINEDVLTDATLLDSPGWRHVIVRFPQETVEAARLLAIYVLPPKGMQLSSGQIVLRNVRAVIAGN
ncbi:MAG: phosphodiester glycosidase family protein, partial [Candidatus Eremiobacteraeota bacterium]|nr:phosphodiester glycosidase family protein [Candidatus Eremiobacteraeota bacterium]